MIPVNIANNVTVTKADIKSEWYNYENKKWANMFIVNSTSRNTYKGANAGTTITSSDILGYFVWIPRYRSQLFNVAVEAGITPQEIKIEFENVLTSKLNGTKNGEWLTAPEFTFGDKKLNGIWVAKFEATGTSDTPTVLPNVSSLRSQNVSTQFTTSQNLMI